MIRPRRSLLFMPGSNARALEKARNLPADGIILDLEDSVAPEAKAGARDQIAQAVAVTDPTGSPAPPTPGTAAPPPGRWPPRSAPPQPAAAAHGGPAPPRSARHHRDTS